MSVETYSGVNLALVLPLKKHRRWSWEWNHQIERPVKVNFTPRRRVRSILLFTCSIMLLITCTTAIILPLYIGSHYRKPCCCSLVAEQLISISAKVHTFLPSQSARRAFVCFCRAFTGREINWNKLKLRETLWEQKQREWTGAQRGVLWGLVNRLLTTMQGTLPGDCAEKQSAVRGWFLQPSPRFHSRQKRASLTRLLPTFSHR